MLSGKQKRYLRSLAVNLKPVVIVGKEGIGNTLIESLDNALTAHELVKIKILETCDLEINEVAIELASVTNSDIIQKIGRVILLYRVSEEHKIKL